MTIEFFEDTAIYQAHYLDEVPYPKLVMLEASSFCNLRCPMCPRTIGKSPSAGASGQEFGNLKMDLLDRLDNLFRQTPGVVLSWFGEPLMNKQLPEIVRRIKTYGASVHITTNGMLLTEQVAEQLVRAGLDNMAISMDAADPETFRRLRAGAELQVVKANVLNLNRVKRRLGSTTPRLQVAFVAMPENVLQLPEMVRLVDEMDIRTLTIGPLDDFALTQEFNLAHKAALGSREPARQAYREARALAQKLDVAIGLESPARFYHEMGDPPPEFAIEERFFRNDYTPGQTTALGLRKGCGVPWLDTVIGYNGDVHPCCVSNRILGNVFEKSFEEIWWGPAYRAFRAQLKSTTAPVECRSCRRAYWNGSHQLDELREAMVVGEDEIHGQGWTSILTDTNGRSHRRIYRESTLFLRYDGQRYLDVELGAYVPMGTPCQITINDVNLRPFQVHVGWEHYYLRLPDLGNNAILKIKIASIAFSQALIRGVSLRQTDSRVWWDRLNGASPVAYLRGLWYAGRQYLSMRPPRLARLLRRVAGKLTNRATAETI
jgi:radical SAM protein with 4Fe4S-binding SPASM domain